MHDIAIRVDSIGKAYRIGLTERRHETIVGALTAFVKAPLSNFRNVRNLSRFDSLEGEDLIWALRDVSFEVKQGDVLGIIGGNGAGKSTLLKILSRVTEPTRGRAEVFGRVASLLEVGTGFHPDLTGRENVYLNGSILGMRKREIDARFDEIVDFAGVEKFIDTPVKRYSSGMRVRLAFSVAAHLEPEVLIIDEVLAVGDAAFQKKCLGKMGEVTRRGRTVLFVSHNMAAVENLCTRGIVLREGQLRYCGTASAAIRHYFQESSSVVREAGQGRNRRPGKGRVRFTRIWLRCDGVETGVVPAGSRVELMLEYEINCAEPISFFKVRVGWTNRFGDPVFGCQSHTSGDPIDSLPTPCGTIVVTIPEIPLAEGVYRVQLWIKCQDQIEDLVGDALEVTVQGGDFFGSGKLMPSDCGLVYVRHKFHVLSDHSKSCPAYQETAGKPE